ncbi:MAG: alpha/beta hydrolase, partial [Proteobacteria bacterium SW_6_67_9]
YPEIAQAPTGRGPYTGPALFIRGGASDYIAQAHEPEIDRRFPDARIYTVSHAAHWVHVEYPDRVLDTLRPFLESAANERGGHQ